LKEQGLKRLHVLAAAAMLALAPLAAVPPAAAEAHVVVVRRAPPPLRHEAIARRPGPSRDWFWQPGFWRWDGHDYDWVGGHWVRRPHRGAVWVAPHWTHRHGEWRFVEGHWR
jgi:WXXGXW repeat (2 copies)